MYTLYEDECLQQLFFSSKLLLVVVNLCIYSFRGCTSHQPYHAHTVQHLLADSNVLAAWHVLCHSQFHIPYFCHGDCCLAAKGQPDRPQAQDSQPHADTNTNDTNPIRLGQIGRCENVPLSSELLWPN